MHLHVAATDHSHLQGATVFKDMRSVLWNLSHKWCVPIVPYNQMCGEHHAYRSWIFAVLQTGEKCTITRCSIQPLHNF
jgi:hypothetical protein